MADDSRRTPFTVTKLEEAERQLRAAIELFFERRDPLAVHTLVSAAHQVLADIGRQRGYAGVFRNPDIVKPGHEREVREAVAHAENFLKHADRDLDKELEFKPIATEVFLLDAIEIHRTITGESLVAFMLFSFWMAATYPEYFHESKWKDAVTAQIQGGGMDFKDEGIILRAIRMSGGQRLSTQ